MSRRIDPRDPHADTRAAGLSHVYIVPCAYEDLLKLGFSRDPLARIDSLHPRYFEVFDLDRGLLIETETVSDARRLELRLRRPIAAHRAPPPLTVRLAAGGGTEWFRGAYPTLMQATDALAADGFRVHAPLRAWLRTAFEARADRLYAWAEQAVPWIEGATQATSLPASLARVRDTLDACVSFGIAPRSVVSDTIADWHAALR